MGKIHINHKHTGMLFRAILLKEERNMKSTNMEAPLPNDFTKLRSEREFVFSSTERKVEDLPDKIRLLELASSGDAGIAEKLVIEFLRRNGDSQNELEILTLIGSYRDNNNIWQQWNGRLLDKYPDSIVGLSLEGLCEGLFCKDWEEVRKCAILIIENDENNWFAISSLATALTRLREWHHAAFYWKKLMELRELKTKEIKMATKAAYNAKEFSLVTSILDDETREKSNDETEMELLVRSYYNLSLDEDCIRVGIELVRKSPENEIVLRHLSRSLFRLGRLSEAIPIMESYCKIAPSDVAPWESLIESQLRIDRVKEAENTWRKLRRFSKQGYIEFLVSIRISLRFNWESEFQELVDEGKKYSKREGFFDDLAEIILENGDLGRSWSILRKNGIDPLDSKLSSRFEDIIYQTGVDRKELDELQNEPLWIAGLVTREAIKRGYRRTKRKKIRCHLVSSSLDRGGAERQVALTLKNMIGDRKFDCFLAVHRLENKIGKGSYFPEMGSSSKRVFNLEGLETESLECPGSDIINENMELLSLIPSGPRKKILQLISHFSEHEPDLVHAWQDETIFTAAIASSLTGVPYFLGSARSLSPAEKTNLHNMKRPYLRSCFREIFGNKGFTLSSNSEAGRRSYSEWIGMELGGIGVIHNGIDFSEMEMKTDLLEVREEFDGFGFKENDIIIGGVFRLEVGKRPELWLDSFEMAKRKNPHLKGLIVGGGKMENTVLHWINEKGLGDEVKLVGEVSDVASWLEMMDIFLFTSLSEGLPNVLIEAQAFGLPVVSTRVGGVSEVVSHRETGLLTDSDSSEEICEELLYLIEDGEYREFSKRARAMSRQKFSVKKMIESTREMYSRIIELR